MTTPALQESFKFALWYGDNAGTTFTFLGAINEVQHNNTNNIAKAKVRDNSQPYAAPTQFARVTSQDSQISGSGYYDKTQFEAIWAIFSGGLQRQWRVSILGGDTLQGAYIVKTLNLDNKDATSDDFGQMSIELELAAGTVTQSVTP